MSSDTSVRVAVRVRPQNERERSQMQEVCTVVGSDNSQIFLGKDKCFTFDYVFDSRTNQERVFETLAKPLVEGCLEGYNATLFAYGQTGSGKTYTMGTAGDSHGIVPQSVKHLFDIMEQCKLDAVNKGLTPTEFKVMAQFLELYNEELIDLLDVIDNQGKGDKAHIRIHEDAKGDIYVTGATTKIVYTIDDAMQCLKDGAIYRSTGSTQMNAQSSRSHAIFTLFVKQRREEVIVQEELATEREVDTTETVMKTSKTLTAKFHFVDLAGSERLKRTGATGNRAKEGIAINCGLLALGNVISALGCGKGTKRGVHIPYRDSKLTRFLQDSLGGNSRTIMIACISPSDCDFLETLTTLQYANRAKNIKNRITVNQDTSSKQVAALRAQVAQLEAELAKYKKNPHALTGVDENSTGMQQEVLSLRERVQVAELTVEGLRARNTRLLAVAEGLGYANNRKALENHSSSASVDLEELGVNRHVAQLIEKYASQIEELKSQLIETEATVSVLRKVKVPLHHLAKTSPSTERRISLPLNNEKMKTKEEFLGIKCESNDTGDIISSETSPQETVDIPLDCGEFVNEEDESNSEDEGVTTETYLLESLVNLDSEISERERLIHELQLKTKQLENMRKQYETEIHRLQGRIQATEEERDKMLSSIEMSGERQKQVRSQYEERLIIMKSELTKLNQANKESVRQQREHSRLESERVRLTQEVEDLKRRKVELARKLREEAKRYREVEAARNREIAVLTKKHRNVEHQLRHLQEDKQRRDVVMRSLVQEVEGLRRRNAMRPPQPSRPATAPTYVSSTTNNSVKCLLTQSATSISIPHSTTATNSMDSSQNPASHGVPIAKGALKKPFAVPSRPPLRSHTPCLRRRQSVLARIFKSKWDEINEAIQNIVSRRHMQARFDSDLNNWIRERQRLALRISRLEQESGQENTNLLSDLRAQIENLQEQIKECQENILVLGEESQPDTKVAAVLAQCSLEEARYIMNHLLEEIIQKGVLVEQKTHMVDHAKQELTKKCKEHEQVLDMLKFAVARPESVRTEMAELLAEHTAQPDETSSDDDLECCGNHADIKWNGDGPRDKKMRRMSTTTEELMTSMLCNTSRNQLSTLTESDGETGMEATTTVSESVPSSVRDKRSMRERSITRSTPLSLQPRPSSQNVLNTTSSQNPSLTDSGVCHPSMRSSAVESVQSYSDRSIPLASPRSLKSVSSMLSSSNAEPRRWPISPRKASQKYIGHISKCDHNHNTTTPSSPIECTHIVEGHTSPVLHVSLAPNLLVSSSKDGCIKMWDLQAMCEKSSPPKQPHSVVKVYYSPATHLCYTASSSYVCVWDERDLRVPIKTLLSTGLSGLTSNNNLVEGFERSSSNLSSLVDMTILDFAVDQSRGESLVMSCPAAIRYWDLRRFESVGKLYTYNHQSVGLLSTDTEVSSSNDNLNHLRMVAGARDDRLYYFSINTRTVTGLVAPTMELKPSPMSPITALTLHGETLFIACKDTSLKKWSLHPSSMKDSDLPYWNFPNAHKDPIHSVCITSDGRNVLSACDRGLLKLWNADNGIFVGEVLAHSSDGINAIANYGNVVATAGNDSIVKLWSL